jgi:hypothetical protein
MISKLRVPTILALSLIATIATLDGCGKDSKSDNVRGGNGRNGTIGGSALSGGNGANGSLNGGSTNGGTANGNNGGAVQANQNAGTMGLIIPEATTPQQPMYFADQMMGPQNPNDVMRNFVKTNLDKSVVGSISPSDDPNSVVQQRCNTSGINCELLIRSMPLTLGMSLSQAMNSNAQVPITQGMIEINMFDSLVGTIAADGTPVTEFPIKFDLSSPSSKNPVNQSYIQGHNLFLQFSDDLGTVTLRGNITNGLVTGSVDFNNTNDIANSGPGARGHLGSFKMNTCAIFTQQCY